MFADTLTFTAQRPSSTARARSRVRSDETIAQLASAGPVAIDLRLSELDEEWDIERAERTLTPLLSIFGISLALSVSAIWLVVPILMQSFSLQLAVQGWSLPQALLRQIGMRSAWEIDEERYALNFLLCEFGDGARNS